MNTALFVIIEIAAALGILATVVLIAGSDRNPGYGPAAGGIATGIGLCFVAMAILARSFEKTEEQEKTKSEKASEE